jgi:hypothetical protein
MAAGVAGPVQLEGESGSFKVTKVKLPPYKARQAFWLGVTEW